MDQMSVRNRLRKFDHPQVLLTPEDQNYLFANLEHYYGSSFERATQLTMNQVYDYMTLESSAGLPYNKFGSTKGDVAACYPFESLLKDFSSHQL
jgi:hypothetical protein